MKNGLIISDAGPIFSLAIIDRLEVLNSLFDEVYIPKAVWDELARDQNTSIYSIIVEFFNDKVKEISGFNELTFIMDYGESEVVKLYTELQADYLLTREVSSTPREVSCPPREVSSPPREVSSPPR